MCLGNGVLIIKGAQEDILSMCSSVEHIDKGWISTFTEDDCRRIDELAEKLSNEGYLVLALVTVLISYQLLCENIVIGTTLKEIDLLRSWEVTDLDFLGCCLDKDCLLAECISDAGWHLQYWEFDEISSVLQKLQSVKISGSFEDSLLWKCSDKVSSCYNMLQEMSGRFDRPWPWKRVRNSKALLSGLFWMVCSTRYLF